MFDVGGGELLLILLAILVLFGPKKIPELAQMFGKGMAQVKKAQAQFQTQINELQNEIKKTAEPLDQAFVNKPYRNIENNDAHQNNINDTADLSVNKEESNTDNEGENKFNYEDVYNLNKNKSDQSDEVDSQPN